MKRDKLKTPEDYEIFSFRTTAAQKEKLNAAINDVVALYNRKKADGERMYRKNDVIMEAIERGIHQMKRSKAK